VEESAGETKEQRFGGVELLECSLPRIVPCATTVSKSTGTTHFGYAERSQTVRPVHINNIFHGHFQVSGGC
jgi:hypothetical protein